jgi:hypothetical protein
VLEQDQHHSALVWRVTLERVLPVAGQASDRGADLSASHARHIPAQDAALVQVQARYATSTKRAAVELGARHVRRYGFGPGNQRTGFHQVGPHFSEHRYILLPVPFIADPYRSPGLALTSSRPVLASGVAGAPLAPSLAVAAEGE